MTAPNPPAVGRKGRWVKLGQVSVDSSQIGICDPGYAKSFDFDTYWKASRGVTDDLRVNDWSSGIAFTAGFGDGGYDVWGWIVDYGDAGEVDERVAQVVITLIDEADAQEWNTDGQ